MKQPEDFLPLSQATYYILLSLRVKRHGYGIMQDVEEISQSEVKMGPGTLYGALGKLEKQQVIQKVTVESDERRKYYDLTELGKQVLQKEYIRLRSLVNNATDIIERLEVEEDGY
ncbi:PadR family transcriptional regulator [Oceanobacillus sp. M65]|uniref:PadR family transcriptional regulator n=1 Tax=Oceanobacillus jordanicus TaxID=2867266 RepID=A0AAW5B6J0_9BACI|nr:PadR family transcriptional regulator [Oceanobacillus jordanicus]AVQ97796.1 PadR family transcriptional regulator [Oceanobacillus iheyensis]MCG3419163.1 PadR family transcriptional regulator [Oceanobacillus jordanicus]NAO99157.1 PadR family transcriptional regulator [Halomonas sp. MG34]